MKRRYLAVLMGVMVAATSVPAVAYAESTQTETAQENTDADSTAEEAKAGDAKEVQDQDEDTIWGEVKSVSDTEITIAVGTKKEMSKAERPQRNRMVTISRARIRMEKPRRSQREKTVARCHPCWI